MTYSASYAFIIACLRPDIEGVATALIKKKIKFSSYIRKVRMEQLQSHISWNKSVLIYEEMRKYLTIYVSSHMLHSEFPYNWGKFDFLFISVFCLTTFVTKKTMVQNAAFRGTACISLKRRGSPGYGVLWSKDILYTLISGTLRGKGVTEISSFTLIFLLFFFLSCLVQGICFIYQLSTYTVHW